MCVYEKKCQMWKVSDWQKKNLVNYGNHKELYFEIFIIIQVFMIKWKLDTSDATEKIISGIISCCAFLSQLPKSQTYSL